MSSESPCRPVGSISFNRRWAKPTARPRSPSGSSPGGRRPRACPACRPSAGRRRRRSPARRAGSPRRNCPFERAGHAEFFVVPAAEGGASGGRVATTSAPEAKASAMSPRPDLAALPSPRKAPTSPWRRYMSSAVLALPRPAGRNPWRRAARRTPPRRSPPDARAAGKTPLSALRRPRKPQAQSPRRAGNIASHTRGG